MKTNFIYKHDNNTDVAMWVLNSLYIPEKDVYKIKCRWLNIVNPKNVFDLGVIDKVEVKRADVKNWKVYEPI